MAKRGSVNHIYFPLACFGTVLAYGNCALGEDERAACVAAAEQAQQLRSAHQLQSSRRQLLDCVQASCPAVVRGDCSQWLVEVDAAIPSVVIRASDSRGVDIVAVRVSVDGAAFQERLDGLEKNLDPGVHRFHFESDGMIPIEQQLVIREGEKRRNLNVLFSPVDTSARDSLTASGPTKATGSNNGFPVLGYALAGLGAAALSSFAYFGINGRIEAADLGAGCGKTKTCSDEQVDPVHTKLIVADVSLAVAVTSLGLSTWLWFSHSAAVPPKSAMVRASTLPGGGQVQLRWRF